MDVKNLEASLTWLITILSHPNVAARREQDIGERNAVPGMPNQCGNKYPDWEQNILAAKCIVGEISSGRNILGWKAQSPVRTIQRRHQCTVVNTPWIHD